MPRCLNTRRKASGGSTIGEAAYRNPTEFEAGKHTVSLVHGAYGARVYTLWREAQMRTAVVDRRQRRRADLLRNGHLHPDPRRGASVSAIRRPRIELSRMTLPLGSYRVFIMLGRS